MVEHGNGNGYRKKTRQRYRDILHKRLNSIRISPAGAANKAVGTDHGRSNRECHGEPGH